MFGTTEEERAGAVGTYWSDFTASLQTWIVMLGRSPTVAEAALTFNVAPELVIDACADAPWIFVAGDPATPTTATLELEGE
jgi:hypothetical protein